MYTPGQQMKEGYLVISLNNNGELSAEFYACKEDLFEDWREFMESDECYFFENIPDDYLTTGSFKNANADTGESAIIFKGKVVVPKVKAVRIVEGVDIE